MAPIITGTLYFAIIFTFAFAMGVIRVLVVAPRLGATTAVCIELPIVLLASYAVARRLLRSRTFALPELISIGVLAFALTMASEAALSVLIWGQSVVQWAQTLTSPLGMLGVGGQLGFAAMPILVARWRNNSHAAADTVSAAPVSSKWKLTCVRLVHSAAWLLFASAILALPVTVWTGKLTWALWLSALVMVEVAILVANRMRCPLTSIAARYTADRSDNFDIYLPAWLARHNKTIFGSAFAAGELFLLYRLFAAA